MCNNCWEYIKGKVLDVNVFETPWDETPTTLHVHENCYEDLFDISVGSFRYFYCSPCGRYVCEQNPSNGYHAQYRIINGEQICLQCYEKEILENGVDTEQLKEGQLPGMFFNIGNHEIKDTGYKVLKENVFINGDKTAKKWAKTLFNLTELGWKVIVAYERLSMMGDEGTVSFYGKKDN
jgi:hypothetical protein